MSMGLASFVAGMGSGYMAAKSREEDRAQRQQEIDMRKQEHDAKMGDIEDGKKLKLSLANAAKPAEVNQNAASLDMGDGPKVYEDQGVANSDYRQARGLASMQPEGTQPAIAAPTQAISVNGKAMGSLADAQQAAEVYNKPDAVGLRLADAYMAAGKPAEALTLQDRNAKIAAEKTKAARDQVEHAAKLKKENVFEGVKHLRAGNAQAMFDALNSSGEYKLLDVPTLTPVERDIPGIGKIKSYDAVIKYAGADGKVFEQKVNSHDMSMQMMPYEKALELQRKGTDTESQVEKRANDAKTAASLAEVRASLAETRAAAAANKGSGSGQREERLRATQLFSDAGRRLGESQRALSTLQRDPEFVRAVRRNPNGPEALQLQGLQNDLKSYQEERALYQGMLAGDRAQPAQKPGLSSVLPPTAAAVAQPKQAAPKSDYSSLWK